MISFKEYLIESKKLKHLEHPEDLHFSSGEEGLTHAFHALRSAHEHLKGGQSDASVSVKHDGSPSVVFGHHPETGRFFVASKSAFNKNPKLNYTHNDIEKNHGHAPGLVDKLKHALNHLPKVAPEKGVFQGDFMYDRSDLQRNERGTAFTPNTLTYSARKNSDTERAINRSHIGVVVHTGYKGKTFQDMEAHPSTDTSSFRKHPDVHMISANMKNKSAYEDSHRAEFNSHLNRALNAAKEFNGDHSYAEGHSENLRTYVNKLVSTNQKPSVEGYKKHVTERAMKDIERVKSPASKAAKTSALQQTLTHIDTHRNKFQASFDTHSALQNAKNVLVQALSASPHEYEYSIRGKKASPEGFVLSSGGRTHKLVNRGEFSRANFETQERKKNVKS